MKPQQSTRTLATALVITLASVASLAIVEGVGEGREVTAIEGPATVARKKAERIERVELVRVETVDSTAVERRVAFENEAELRETAPRVEPRATVDPTLATLVAEVRDGAGRPRTGALVRLHAGESGSNALALARTDDTGRVQISGLDTNVDLALVVFAPGQPLAEVAIDPLAAGEERFEEVVLGAPVVALDARMIDEHGHPLADCNFRLRSDADVFSVVAESDANGVLCLELAERFADAPLADLSIELLDSLGQGTQRQVALDRFVPGLGRNALGTLAVAEAPILVAGQVLGAASDLHDVRLLVESYRDGAWRIAPTAGVFPIGEGAFEIRGIESGAQHRLIVHGHGTRAEAPVDFLPGERELRVEVAS